MALLTFGHLAFHLVLLLLFFRMHGTVCFSTDKAGYLFFQSTGVTLFAGVLSYNCTARKIFLSQPCLLPPFSALLFLSTTTAITGSSLRQQVKQPWTHPHVFLELRVTIHWWNACLCFLRLGLGVNINYGAGPTLLSGTAHVPHTSLLSHLWPLLHTKGCLWDIFSRGTPSSHGTWLSNKLAS